MAQQLSSPFGIVRMLKKLIIEAAGPGVDHGAKFVSASFCWIRGHKSQCCLVGTGLREAFPALEQLLQQRSRFVGFPFGQGLKRFYVILVNVEFDLMPFDSPTGRPDHQIIDMKGLVRFDVKANVKFVAQHVLEQLVGAV
jgi:hypothetical protein